MKDEGTDSIADVEGIDVFDVQSFSDFEDVYWWLKKNPKKYKTVVIDTCTQLQNMVVQEIGGEKSSKKGKQAGDWGSMTKRDWGEVSALLKEWLVNYRDLTKLGITVIFIAQDRTFNLSDEENENTELLAPEIGPALSPSVARTLNAAVSVVANTYIRERTIEKEVKGKKVKKKVIEYCLGVGPSSLYTRKVRKPKRNELPDVIVNPEFDDLVALTRGE